MRKTVFRPALAFALAAMLLRALLPAGWMPNPEGARISAFVICTVDGPRHIVPPAHGQDHERAGAPCAFALAAAPFAPSAAPAIRPAGGAALDIAAPLSAPQFLPRVIFRDANRSRAPPVLT